MKKEAARLVPVAHAGSRRYWRIKEAYCAPSCEYKNKILATLQDKLIHREPTITSDALKKFSMQMYQENGAFNIWETGGTDRGCSYGLGQWYVCPRTNARAALARECAKNSAGKCDYEAELERQLYKLADDMIGSYRAYKGNIRLAIVAYNRPASAAAGTDQCLAGSNNCYYKDQVMRHVNSFELR